MSPWGQIYKSHPISPWAVANWTEWWCAGFCLCSAFNSHPANTAPCPGTAGGKPKQSTGQSGSQNSTFLTHSLPVAHEPQPPGTFQWLELRDKCPERFLSPLLGTNRQIFESLPAPSIAQSHLSPLETHKQHKSNIPSTQTHPQTHCNVTPLFWYIKILQGLGNYSSLPCFVLRQQIYYRFLIQTPRNDSRLVPYLLNLRPLTIILSAGGAQFRRRSITRQIKLLFLSGLQTTTSLIIYRKVPQQVCPPERGQRAECQQLCAGRVDTAGQESRVLLSHPGDSQDFGSPCLRLPWNASTALLTGQALPLCLRGREGIYISS